MWTYSVAANALRIDCFHGGAVFEVTCTLGVTGALAAAPSRCLQGREIQACRAG